MGFLRRLGKSSKADGEAAGGKNRVAALRRVVQACLLVANQ